MELTAKNNKNPVGLQTLRVLIADDDPATRILLRAAIAQWGYEVLEAKNGEEAWDVLDDPVGSQLLILDWLMPKLNGIDLCMRIRQKLSYQPYIILLTQVAGMENITKGLEAGADEFLSKPFNMAELQSRLFVGARIINYENALTAQNQKIQRYISNMETLSAFTLALSSKIDQIEKISAESNKTNAEAMAWSENFRELETDLTQIIVLIKSFLSSSKS